MVCQGTLARIANCGSEGYADRLGWKAMPFALEDFDSNW